MVFYELLSDIQLADDVSVSFDIDFHQVVKQSSSLTDHHEQTST